MSVHSRDVGNRSGELSHRDELRGQQLRDRLLQIVYDAGRIDTSGVREALGEYEAYSITCGHRDCDDPAHRRRHGKRSYWNSDFVPALRSLAKTGEIVHTKSDVGRHRSRGDWWQSPDWREPDVVDAEAEQVLDALRYPPVNPKTLDSRSRAMVRGRAMARLRDRHSEEFELLFWKEAGIYKETGR